MDTQILIVFCLCTDMLQALHHYEDAQCQMTDAEVMTTAIVADLFLTLFFRLSETWKQLNERLVYAIDSYPIVVCDNYRIPRQNLLRRRLSRLYRQ